MLHVPKLPVILHVHVTLDMKEMESCVQVCILLEIYTIIYHKSSRQKIIY